MNAGHGLAAVITASVVWVAAAYILINRSKDVGTVSSGATAAYAKFVGTASGK